MKKTIITILSLTFLLLAGCKEDDPKPVPGNPSNPNNPEVITSVLMIFTDTSTSTIVDTLYFRDAALSGLTGIYDSLIVLNPSTTYDVNIKVWDESKNPLDDITEEIVDEADEHQFFFEGTAIVNSSITFTYKDQDGNGRPLGLENYATTNSVIVPSSFKVTLKHKLDKSLTTNGVYVPSAGGDTDVEVTFYIQ